MKNLENIRLTEEEIKAIKETAKEVFGEDVRVWLFGSRVNPDSKGGDIDIYIETNDLFNIIDKKIKYLAKLKLKIGDQKIDLIVKSYDCTETICVEAKKTGVKLT